MYHVYEGMKFMDEQKQSNNSNCGFCECLKKYMNFRNDKMDHPSYRLKY